tara:strand:+ start:1095 stop:1211 length:117 start_codon:yes stop_codon:yes gene_type:complete
MSLPTPIHVAPPSDEKVVKIDFIRDPPFEIIRILRGDD